MGTMIRVATINILNDLSRWDERRVLLAAGLHALSPDLIALQEVRDPPGTSTAHRLAGELDGDSVHARPKTGWVRYYDRPSPGDPTLYASDHLGLAATLEIPPHEGS